jgi:hypothetical protein
MSTGTKMMNDSNSIPPHLGDEAVRRRLGPTGWKAFRRIIRIWQVPEETWRMLLGIAREMDLDSIDPEHLTEEQMLRLSYLIGIYKGLHILLNDPLSDEWVRRPNDDAMFGGQAPLTYMASGGIGALRNVRRMIDAKCVGN